MAYKNLSNEQAAKLAQTLGPEFIAAAKNDLINFADAILGLAGVYAPFEVPEVEVKAKSFKTGTIETTTKKVK